MRHPSIVLAFTVPVVGVIAATLSAFAQIVEPYLAVHYGISFEMFMVLGQVGFQWLFLWRNTWRDRFLYAHHVLTISLMGSALLWPLLVIHEVSPVRPVIALLYFMSVVAFMFVNHAHGVVTLGLPRRLSYTWVLFRVFILLVVVKW